MNKTGKRKLFSIRHLLAFLLGCLCILIFAAPFLLSHACIRSASVIYFSYSFFCHQIPARTFFLFGHPLAVCHRCTGIYIGLFLGSIFTHASFHRSHPARRFWILSAALLMALDALLPYIGLWESTSLSRFSTGVFLGYLISLLLAHGIVEFLDEGPRKRLSPVDYHLKGEIV